MKLPASLVLFSASLAGTGWLLDSRVALEFGVLMVLAALILLIAAARRPGQRPGAGAGARPRRVRAWSVIDGSNVLFWGGPQADLQNVLAVVQAVRARGREPLVWFDANAGYRICDRYLRDDELAQLLNLPGRQVRIAPSGTPADPLILADATKLSATVISNDRFRDWHEQFPLARDPRRVIRGRIAAGTARLERPSAAAA